MKASINLDKTQEAFLMLVHFCGGEITSDGLGGRDIPDAYMLNQLQGQGLVNFSLIDGTPRVKLTNTGRVYAGVLDVRYHGGRV